MLIAFTIIDKIGLTNKQIFSELYAPFKTNEIPTLSKSAYMGKKPCINNTKTAKTNEITTFCLVVFDLFVSQ